MAWKKQRLNFSNRLKLKEDDHKYFLTITGYCEKIFIVDQYNDLSQIFFMTNSNHFLHL